MERIEVVLLIFGGSTIACSVGFFIWMFVAYTQLSRTRMRLYDEVRNTEPATRAEISSLLFDRSQQHLHLERLTEFCNSNHLDQIPAVKQEKERYRKLLRMYSHTFTFFLVTLLTGGMFVVIATVMHLRH